MSKRSVIAVTMGDPGGVGPEVALKSLKSLKPSADYSVIVFGIPSVFEALLRRGLRFPQQKNILFYDVSDEILKIYKSKAKSAPKKIKFNPGKVSFENAAAAFASLKFAAEQAAAGKIQAIVTAPINKTAMRLLDPKFHGHTEYLAQTSGTNKFAMMFVSSKLNVTLATIHEPIKNVPALITQSLIFEKIALTDQFLKKKMKIKKPKIAVCALNPHGKETGTEDEKEIRPAVARACRRGILAFGPYSADQLFYEAYHKHYDAVIAMYHDQGLTPFKMIAFDDGVNVTLGLPYIRTSPDHGTAFDIAYQNKANPVSMLAALKLALKMVR